MSTHRFRYLTLLCLLAAFTACEPPEDPQPQRCDFATPQLSYSLAENCSPDLVYLRDLQDPQAGNLPNLVGDCKPSGAASRIVELPANPLSGNVIFHVYNGSSAVAAVQVFGALSCTGTMEPLTECITNDGVAFKVQASVPQNYASIFVRIDLLDPVTGEGYDPTATNFVAVAAYDGKEPGLTYRMPYNEKEIQQPGQAYVPPASLPVSCSGLTFQRIILSSCSPDQNLEAWAEEMGLPVSESYNGKSGSVLAAEVPNGMDVQTTGGAAPEQRPKQDTTGTSVEPDYIISLFNPDDKDDYFIGSLEQTSVKSEEIRNCVAFRPEAASDEGAEQVIVSIIDSGVDYAKGNVGYWEQTVYRQSLTTNFLRYGQLGFDFINNDVEPEDQTPHGTFVAGAVVGGYRGEQPLTTVHWKIFGAEKAATYFGALVALREALTINSDVVNMSWGFYTNQTPRALQCLVEEAQSRGAVLVTSAGNETKTISVEPQWPASFAERYPETVVSVASYEFANDAIDPNDLELTSFSNRGAPDVAVAAFMTTETPAYGGVGTAYYLGTSISAPIVTRTVATLAAGGRGDVAALRSRFDRASQLSGLTVDEQYLPVCPEDFRP